MVVTEVVKGCGNHVSDDGNENSSRSAKVIVIFCCVLVVMIVMIVAVVIGVVVVAVGVVEVVVGVVVVVVLVIAVMMSRSGTDIGNGSKVKVVLIRLW